MAKHLQRDLDELQRDLLALAGLVEGAIHKAIRALQDRDVRLAREVIAGDNQIDNEENHIDEECLKMLALHQPVAVDLRRITAAMMIVVDLERMGDLAEEIAERALQLARPPHLPIPERLQRMTDLTTTMVRQSLDAFVNLDARHHLHFFDEARGPDFLVSKVLGRVGNAGRFELGGADLGDDDGKVLLVAKVRFGIQVNLAPIFQSVLG